MKTTYDAQKSDMRSLTTFTDYELISRCKYELPRITRSYDILIERYTERIFHTVYRLVRNKEEAEDITQEVFVKVYQRIGSFEQRSSFSTWLFRVASNCAFDALRRMKHQEELIIPVFSLDEYVPQETGFLSSGPEEHFARIEDRELIRQILHRLGRRQARLLIMREIEGMSYQEIAQVLGIGLSAVKMRIQRARGDFRAVVMREERV